MHTKAFQRCWANCSSLWKVFPASCCLFAPLNSLKMVSFCSVFVTSSDDAASADLHQMHLVVFLKSLLLWLN